MSESEFLKFEERKREKGKRDFWAENRIGRVISLSISLLINETNEKENVQELEENSKERE